MKIQVYEAERGFIDYTLMYAPNWSVVAKRNTPVLQADVTTLYFFVKNPSGTAVLSLTSASSSQIEWLSSTAGTIRVKLGTNTEGKVNDDNDYELRILFTDNGYVTADAGKLDILESVVDTP